MNSIMENDFRNIVGCIHDNDCELYELGIRLRPFIDTFNPKQQDYFGKQKIIGSSAKPHGNESMDMNLSFDTFQQKSVEQPPKHLIISYVT